MFNWQSRGPLVYQPMTVKFVTLGKYNFTLHYITLRITYFCILLCNMMYLLLFLYLIGLFCVT